MSQYLLDTNILLRGADISSPQHSLATEAITLLLEAENECIITSQVLVELWVVATRPIEVNGLGWNTQQTTFYLNQLLDNFIFIEETSDIFPLWFQLVVDYNIKGKRTHDIRLLAVMKANNIPHLLTFNPDDFMPLLDITIIHPQDIINLI